MTATLKATLTGFLLGWIGFAFGQDGPETLQEKFDQMMTKSNNYEIYKVIPKTQINELWLEVKDSIGEKRNEVLLLQNEINEFSSRIDTLENQLLRTNSQLAEARLATESINFLGGQMTKTGYHWLVWSIIVVLCLGVIAVYFYSVAAAKSSGRIKKDHEYLRREYEAHKDRSRETQVRLKRELQTAINTIDELKKGKVSR